MATQQQLPSPLRIFETFNAYQRTAALRAGIELDLFTAIGEGINDSARLAAHCKASERGTRILCDYLTIMGLLEKRDGRYFLTPESAAFLDRRSPACIASAATFLTAPLLQAGYSDLAAAVRKGGTTVSAEGTMEPDHPIWVDFARGMAPMMAPLSQFIAELVRGRKVRKVLDIAAGHGLFGIAIAKAQPEAEVVAVDWTNVLAVAKENAKAAGIESRYSTIEGSAFDVDLKSGYDLVLLTNFLHHFDRATCEKLLGRLRATMSNDGILVTLEFIPNEDRITPPASAAFSMMMLGSTASGDAYTFSEYERMFKNAGFGPSTLHQIPNAPNQVIVTAIS